MTLGNIRKVIKDFTLVMVVHGSYKVFRTRNAARIRAIKQLLDEEFGAKGVFSDTNRFPNNEVVTSRVEALVKEWKKWCATNYRSR